jgi:hypothetical protein
VLKLANLSITSSLLEVETNLLLREFSTFWQNDFTINDDLFLDGWMS